MVPVQAPKARSARFNSDRISISLGFRKRRRSTELVEEGMIDFEDFFPTQAQLFRLKQLDEPLPSHQLNRKDSVAIGLLLGIRTEPAGGEENSFISAAHDGIAKVPNLSPTD